MSPGHATPAAPSNVFAFEARANDGAETPLATYRGKVLLIVNTASRCGFTPQYEALEQLYERYHARGFEVLAFPANDFLHQEPGTDAEIRTFCTTKYKTSFPLFAKIRVKGKDIHPLYRYLTQDSPYRGDIRWNFTKFLVSADGRVVGRFEPATDPASKDVTSAIEGQLARQ